MFSCTTKFLNFKFSGNEVVFYYLRYASMVDVSYPVDFDRVLDDVTKQKYFYCDVTSNIFKQCFDEKFIHIHNNEHDKCSSSGRADNTNFIIIKHNIPQEFTGRFVNTYYSKKIKNKIYRVVTEIEKVLLNSIK